MTMAFFVALTIVESVPEIHDSGLLIIFSGFIFLFQFKRFYKTKAVFIIHNVQRS